MLERLRQQVASAISSARSGGSRATPTARYLRPDNAGVLQAWQPALRSQADDVRVGWSAVAARTIDAAHNQGWIAGGIQQQIVDINGPTGLLLNATPDWDALGWTEAYAQTWSRRVERRFRAWSRNPLECDVRGKMTLAAMADSIVRWYFPFGEGLARILVRDKPGATSKTKLQMTSPHRLSQDTSEFERLYQGVYLDPDGAPIGYRMLTREMGYSDRVNMPARDADGRPLIVHVMDGDPDQTRGISPLAPVLRVTRQYDQTQDATLTAMLLQTIFAATMESALPTGEVLDGLLTDVDVSNLAGGADPTSGGGVAALIDQRLQWYQSAKIDLGVHGRINSMFPGDALKFHRSEHPNGNYLPMSENLLREIARCMGITFEAFTGNYRGATFSSMKMGTATTFPVTVRRRERIPQPVYQAAYDAWLEEEVAEGRTEFPGGYSKFLKYRAAACQAQWRGPAKPTPDEGRTSTAMKTYKDMGLLSLSTIGAEIGVDWEVEQEQRAQERRRIVDELGLPDPYAPQPGAPAPTEEPEPKDPPAGGTD